MIGHIYLIASKRIDGGIYVGSSINYQKRWNKHKKSLKQGNHCNPWLQKAYNKHGVDDFVYLIAEECLKTHLIEREQKWINTLKTGNIKVFNMIPAGVPPCGDEVRLKISQSLIGNTRTKGWTPTEETRKKMSIAQTGRTHTLETKVKCSIWQRGRNLTPEHIANSIRGRRGLKHTEGTKAKISAYWRKRRETLD